MNKKIAVVILAAGKGTRMKSNLPKVLHPVLGKPMIHYVVEEALKLKPFEIIPVVSWHREMVEKSLTDTFGFVFQFAHQKTPQGTGDAVKWALKHMSESVDTVVVLSGDAPLVNADILTRLLDSHTDQITIATTHLADPAGYGRIVRSKDAVVKIVEEKNASPAEKKICEINAGLYCFNKKFLNRFINSIAVNNMSGEYYLTDLVDLAVNAKISVGSYIENDCAVLLGINSRKELAEASRLMQKRICNRFMEDGVTILAPERVYIEPGVTIGADTVIYPDVSLFGKTEIASEALIENGSIISDSIIGPNVRIKPYCVIESSKIHNAAVIGPFAHLRPDSVIEEKAKVGNFVETKKATLRKGAKANHLAYIGDALVEENVNIGAGAITCNYDGEKKHATYIKKGAFIGTNTSLVAPVTVGENAVTAAGSVITKDVPDGSLAVERSEQRTIANWHQVKKRIKKEK